MSLLDLYRPVSDDWFVRDLDEARERLGRLEAGYDLDSATIGEGGMTVTGDGGILVEGGGGLVIADKGTVVVTDGGGLEVDDFERGTRVFYVGERPIPDGTQRRQQVIYLFRDDKTAALQLADNGTNPDHPHQQALQWFDRSGRTVVADDTVGGHGLAAPHIETGGLHNTNLSTYPATDSGDWTTIAKAYVEIQNPRLTWQVEHYADTSGSLRMLVDGVAITDDQAVANSFGLWSTNADRPSSVDVGDVVLVQMQARVTGGSGKLYAQCLRLAGQQS